MPIIWLHSTSMTVILTNMSMLDVFYLACVSVAMIMWWNSGMGQLVNGPGQTYWTQKIDTAMTRLQPFWLYQNGTVTPSFAIFVIQGSSGNFHKMAVT